MAVIELAELDWPAHGKAIVVFALCVPDVLSSSPRVVLSDSVREGGARAKSLVHDVIVCAPMELIRAGLHRVVEVPASSLSVLGGIIARLDCHLLDRVNARLIDLILLPPHAVGGILTLNSNGVRAGRHSINAERVVVGECRARQQRNRLQWVSNVTEATNAG